MFNDAPGFFNSVNLTIPENSTWELKDGRQMPHLCQLVFDFQYIGKENPTMTSMHYDNISKSFPFEEPQVDKALPTPGRRQQRRTQRDSRREQFEKDLADPNVSRRQARQRRRQQRRLDREKRRQETKFGT